jgi:methylmalonyl-CoA mutase cobalamin-binding subunit
MARNLTQRRLQPTAQLISEGRRAAPRVLPATKFTRDHGVRSEAGWKKQCRDSGRVMYHLHIGHSTWEATESALRTIDHALAEEGHRVDRFGIALDRAMGTPEADRDAVGKETGPRIGPHEWSRLTSIVAMQPHLGDYMIGFPASFQNTIRALNAGVSTIGNVGQFTAFDLLGGSDEIVVTEQTVRSIAALGSLREQGALVHSNLEDGSATQAAHFGNYVGWAALEMYVVEALLGARLTHCFGNTIQRAQDRAVVHFALDDLRGRDSIGSMIYGNTVDQRPFDRANNEEVVRAQLRCDIALQLRRPTGHAINPVPLSEAERIPSAEEIIEVHLLAREIEREVRSNQNDLDWIALEAVGSDIAMYAHQFRDRALQVFDRNGVDTADAAQMLLALRRITMGELEDAVDLVAPPGVETLVPWKAANLRRLSNSLLESPRGRLDGVRVVLAVLEVHDLVRDALARALPALGAEVIVLGSGASIESIATAASHEDADAIVLGVYNGNALMLGETLTRSVAAKGWDGRIFIGGILNQDTGAGLPIDARPGLAALGITCVDQVESLLEELSPGRKV